jgi:hypothetical protein
MIKERDNLMNEAMNIAVNDLIEAIKTDYFNFLTRMGEREPSTYAKEQMETFYDKIEVRPGQKYIKIIKDRSVWGFIVNTENDKKFRKGDILKAAGWAAPARNAARGNILDGGYRIQWTGPFYL